MAPLALVAGVIPYALEKLRVSTWWPAIAFVLLLAFAQASWRQASNYIDAETVYRMAIDRNPECWPAYTNLGAQFLQERRLDDAIEYCQKALTIKSDVPETQYNLGNCYLATGDFNRAIEPYQRALQLQPRNPRTHSNLAACLASTGNIDGALSEWQEAIRVDPTYAEAHYNLGYVLAQMGRREEAITQLSEAVRLKPDYTAAKEQLRALGGL
jgi:tetratricopeptide (TPR) repeat protein